MQSYCIDKETDITHRVIAMITHPLVSISQEGLQHNGMIMSHRVVLIPASTHVSHDEWSKYYMILLEAHHHQYYLLSLNITQFELAD
jgi:hypothetical protein